ncbi:hypothetical protein GCM10007937_10220 [Mesorhizobium albiziae]|nr:hypothetical protein GCM10007937_10220 [Mesorhizobium albiziae]
MAKITAENIVGDIHVAESVFKLWFDIESVAYIYKSLVTYRLARE